MDESRRSRFRRLANKRVNNLMSQIRVLGNLSNKSYYDFRDDDIRKMFKVIDEQIRVTKSKFKAGSHKFRL
jgi:hypothetical protein